MDTLRKRGGAATVKSTRTAKRAAPATKPKPKLVKYSFSLDDIKSIEITRTPILPYIASGVVVNPPRPRPFVIEVTVEQPAS